MNISTAEFEDARNRAMREGLRQTAEEAVEGLRKLAASKHKKRP